MAKSVTLFIFNGAKTLNNHACRISDPNPELFTYPLLNGPDDACMKGTSGFHDMNYMHCP